MVTEFLVVGGVAFLNFTHTGFRISCISAQSQSEKKCVTAATIVAAYALIIYSLERDPTI
jgi:hypothetical protein